MIHWDHCVWIVLHLQVIPGHTPWALLNVAHMASSTLLGLISAHPHTVYPPTTVMAGRLIHPSPGTRASLTLKRWMSNLIPKHGLSFQSTGKRSQFLCLQDSAAWGSYVCQPWLSVQLHSPGKCTLCSPLAQSINSVTSRKVASFPGSGNLPVGRHFWSLICSLSTMSNNCLTEYTCADWRHAPWLKSE